LPLWLEQAWGPWSTFGGGGCEIHRGGDSRDFCLAGWALIRQLVPALQLGLEVEHESPGTVGGSASTVIGMGLHYDLSDRYHLLAYTAQGLQDAAASGRYSWYTALLCTF